MIGTPHENDARALHLCPADTVPSAWLARLGERYDTQLRVPGLEERTFAPEHWWSLATPLMAPDKDFRVEDIGRSAEGRPLRHVRWGTGSTGVLLWSQMRGDESTASMTLVDLFHFLGEHLSDPLVACLRQRLTLHFMPIANPDGAARFQRHNAQGIDLNRDAKALSSPEARALKALHDQVRPTFGFNLHDQRVGYRVSASDSGAAITLPAGPTIRCGPLDRRSKDPRDRGGRRDQDSTGAVDRRTHRPLGRHIRPSRLWRLDDVMGNQRDPDRIGRH